MATATRRRLLRTVSLAGLGGTMGCAAPQRSEPTSTPGPTDRRPTATATRTTAVDYETIPIPDRYPTIQAGVEAAAPGDLVLVAPGTYPEAVTVSTPDVTVRGRDRNRVVLEGEYDRTNGVEVTADGVALENLTARHYRSNGFHWTGVAGFRGSFLTAYNNGYYGVYAYGSRDGRFEHCYASGHPDAGVYLGRNQPYEAVVDDVVAEHNAIGYSGTSTGTDLTVRDSVWRHNKVGMFPNTLDTVDPPQRSSRLIGNDVYANNDRNAPALPDPYPLTGMGILLWGASENVVMGNRVRDHEYFGIVAQPHVVEASNNLIRDNHVGGSGLADLALGRPAGDGNRFRDNTYETSLPQAIGENAATGSSAVTEAFEDLEGLVDTDGFPSGDWQTQPVPGDQPTMPDPEAPPRPANQTTSWSAPRAQTDGFELGGSR